MHTHKHRRTRARKLNEILSNKSFYVPCKITQCNPQALHAAHSSLTLHSTAHAALTLHTTSLSLPLPTALPTSRSPRSSSSQQQIHFNSHLNILQSQRFFTRRSRRQQQQRRQLTNKNKLNTTTITTTCKAYEMQQLNVSDHATTFYLCTKQICCCCSSSKKTENYFVDTFPHTHTYIHIVDLVCVLLCFQNFTACAIS